MICFTIHYKSIAGLIDRLCGRLDNGLEYDMKPRQAEQAASLRSVMVTEKSFAEALHSITELC